MNSPGITPGIQYRVMSKSKTGANKMIKRSKKPNNCEPNGGDRRYGVPAAIGVTVSSKSPRINDSSGFHIRRSEFVGTATNNGTGFALTTVSQSLNGYDFNPSSPLLFPWLSRIAQNYERFRFNKLSFKFVPAQATSTAGRFYAAVDYDFDDAPAQTKTALMGNRTAIESAVWNECRLECDPKSLTRDIPYKYVNCTTRGLDVEQRTAYAGYLMVAFDVQVACYMDIWVEYDVELVTPVLDEDIVQTNTVSLVVTPAAANVTTAVGAGFAGPLPVVTSTPNPGPIQVVTPGSQNVPLMYINILANAFAAVSALDISNAKGMGGLVLDAVYLVTGQTPANMLVLSLQPTYEAFDSNGQFLADITAYTKYQAGCDLPTEMATASKLMRHIAHLDLHTLLSSLPTVKYIAGCITNTGGACGAGYKGFGFKWSI